MCGEGAMEGMGVLKQTIRNLVEALKINILNLTDFQQRDHLLEEEEL